LSTAALKHCSYHYAHAIFVAAAAAASRPLQDSPFFTVKLGIKVLPAVVVFKGGVSVDRLVGFQQLGGRDDFSTADLEARLAAAGITGGVRRGAAAGGEESEDEEDQTAASIRRGIVHKGSDDESSDFDD
jgi:hypothetical protein